MKDVMPIALSRRLVLALAGFTYVDGWWICACGHESLTEEALDTMSAQAWRRYVQGWLSSATTN
jgi:hypothetical protein